MKPNSHAREKSGDRLWKRGMPTIIGGMYSGPGDIRVETEVAYQDGRKGVLRALVKVREVERT